MIPAPLETGMSDNVPSKNVGHRDLESPQLIGPNITVTPPTKTTPGGKIFEDSVRGTIFWEALDLPDEGGENDRPETIWGNIFRVEWIKW